MTQHSPDWGPRTKTLVLIALTILGAGFLWLISDAFARLLLAVLFAFVASFPIRSLMRLGLGRGASLAISYVGVLAALTLLLVLGIPALLNSLEQVDWAGIAEALTEWAAEALEALRLVTLFGTTYDLSELVDPILETLADAEPGEAVSVDLDRLLELFSTGAGVLFGIASALVGSLVEFFTILVIAIYFSIFLPGVRSAFPAFVPEGHRSDMENLADRMWSVLDQYASGMLRVGLFIGGLTWIGLWVLGVPGAFFLGAIAGLLNIIPTLGPILAGVPGTVIALVQGSNRFDDINRLWFAVIVIVWYFVVQQIETQLATPRIMGGAVRLSPLLVLLGVLVGLQVGGILGALIAVPLLLVIREALRYAHAKLLDEDPYPPEEASTGVGDADAVAEVVAEEGPDLG